MSGKGTNGGIGSLEITHKWLAFFMFAVGIVSLLGIAEAVIGFICVAHCVEFRQILTGIHGIVVGGLGVVTGYQFYKASNYFSWKRFIACSIVLDISTIIIFGLSLGIKCDHRLQNGIILTTLPELIILIVIQISVCCRRICK